MSGSCIRWNGELPVFELVWILGSCDFEGSLLTWRWTGASMVFGQRILLASQSLPS